MRAILSMSASSPARSFYSRMVKKMNAVHKELKPQEQEDASHSLGGSMRAVLSGSVQLKVGHVNPSNGYGSATKWQLALLVGNGIKSGAKGSSRACLSLLEYFAKSAQRSGAEMKYSADKSTGTAHFPDGNKVSFLFSGGRSYNTFAIRFEPAQ